MKRRVGNLLGFSLRAAAIVGAIVLFGVLVFSLGERKSGSAEQSSRAPPHEKQLADADLEKHLTAAVDKVRPQLPSIALGGVVSGPPQASNKLIADGIASKLKNLPVEYNKPNTLLLGNSTPVQFVIKTSEKQELSPLFKGLEGELAKRQHLSLKMSRQN